MNEFLFCFRLKRYQNMNWQELNDNIRMGRECSLLGQYDTALVYYDSCLQLTSRVLMTGNRDMSKQQRWITVSKKIKQ